MAELAKATESEALPDWDAAADEAIAACDGDARASVKALLVLIDTLERDAALLRLAMPFGFARGWFHRQDGGKSLKVTTRSG